MRLGAILLIPAVVLLVAGCGSPSPGEQFAEGACASIAMRAQQILDLQNDVVHTRAVPGTDTRPQLYSIALAAQNVASAFRSDIRKLRAPDTDAGRDAVVYLQDSARRASEKMVGAERDVRRLPERLTLVQAIRGLEDLQLQLTAAFIDVISGPRLITMEIAELKEPFEKADPCKEVETLAGG